jgi:hypothetical protein
LEILSIWVIFTIMPSKLFSYCIYNSDILFSGDSDIDIIMTVNQGVDDYITYE